MADVQGAEGAAAALEAAKAVAAGRRAIRERNLARTGGVVPRTLKSDVKKSTSVVKRFKTLTGNDCEWAVGQLTALNLTRYVPELTQAFVQAVVDGKLKYQDVPLAVPVLTALHTTYTEVDPPFWTHLVECLQGACDTRPLLKQGGEAAGSYRTVVRLLLEVYAAGIAADVKVLKKTLSVVFSPAAPGAAPEKTLPPPTEKAVAFVTGLLKVYGHEIFGFVPAAAAGAPGEDADAGEIEEWAHETASRDAAPVLTAAETAGFKSGFMKYFAQGVKAYEAAAAEYEALVAEAQEAIKARGELPEEKKTQMNEAQAALEKLLASLGDLGKALDCVGEVPAPCEAVQLSTGGGGAGVNITFMSGTAGYYAPVADSAFASASLYDDEEQRAFYEDLIEVRDVEGLPAWVADAEARKALQKAAADAEDKQPDAPRKSPPDATRVDELLRTMYTRCTGKISTDAWIAEFLKEVFAPAATADGEAVAAAAAAADVAWVSQFAGACRKKLARAVFDVNRNAFNAFPMYARVVAVCNAVEVKGWKETGSQVAALFEDDFYARLRQDSQMWIEERRRNVRMLAELCKFGLYAPVGMLNALAKLVDDFAHHNIETACHLVEAGGRYLHRLPTAAVRLQSLLQHMTRLTEHKHLDPRQEVMVENALLMARPPELDPAARRCTRTPKVRPPLEMYVRALLFERLSKDTAGSVVRKFRKLDYSDDATVAMVARTLRKVHRARHGTLDLLTQVVASTRRYCEAVSVRLVDNLMESIRTALEICPPRTVGMQPVTQQRRLLDMEFLAQLYIYGLVDESLLVCTLYMLLYYAGWNDPRGYYFRIRLACTLLEPTLPYLADSPQGRKNLFRFLAFFYAYIHSKAHPFPVDLDFTLAGLVEYVHEVVDDPAAKSLIAFPGSRAEADARVATVEKVMKGEYGPRGKKHPLLGGTNLAMHRYVTWLRDAPGNPAAPPASEADRSSSSLVPFRSKVHPLALLHGGGGVKEACDDEAKPGAAAAAAAPVEQHGVRVLKRGAVAPGAGAAAAAMRTGVEGLKGLGNVHTPAVEDEGEDVPRPRAVAKQPSSAAADDDSGGDDVEERKSAEPAGDPETDADYRGRVPLAGRAAFPGRVQRGGERKPEDDEFDSMFNSMMKESFEHVRHTQAMKSLKAGGGQNTAARRNNDRIAEKMSLPVAAVKRAGEEAAAKAGPGAGGHTAYTVVMRKKAANVDGPSMKIGNKAVSLGVLHVPSDVRLAVNLEDRRQHRREEEEDAARRVLALEARAAMEERGALKTEIARRLRGGR
eukprot:TRINITY_DN2321_c1_g2_i1.p1 TRINITY_DN2321_c1_g2~~TRINITY_DN2321_c1_g2_i1.p1  ORF type:complete len:1305 (+),score=554.78 TRINITY_DN2321_c1_g2_i1:64-3915(+)